MPQSVYHGPAHRRSRPPIPEAPRCDAITGRSSGLRIILLAGPSPHQARLETSRNLARMASAGGRPRSQRRVHGGFTPPSLVRERRGRLRTQVIHLSCSAALKPTDNANYARNLEFVNPSEAVDVIYEGSACKKAAEGGDGRWGALKSDKIRFLHLVLLL